MREFHVEQFPEMAATFLRDGFGVVPCAFSPEFMASALPMLSVNSRRVVELFREHDAVFEIASELFDGEQITSGRSTVQLARGDFANDEWHYDIDWEAADGGVIPIWRFTIYFADYVEHSGGLGVVAGSHLGPTLARKYVLPVAVMSRPGDLVVRNIRTLHRDGMKNALRPYAPTRCAVHFDLAATGYEADRFFSWQRMEAARMRLASKNANNVSYPSFSSQVRTIGNVGGGSNVIRVDPTRWGKGQ